MCLFCDTRLNTLREIQAEIRSLERVVRQHKDEMRQCEACNKPDKPPLKHPERRWSQQAYYQANREKKLAQAKLRYQAKKIGNQAKG